jgi:hypothetical protein
MNCDRLRAPAVPLSGALDSMAVQVAAAQHRLDEDYRRAAEEFQPILDLAKGSAFETLARSLEPAPLGIGHVEIELRFAFARGSQRGFAVRVLNAAYVTRYPSGGFLEQSVKFTVMRGPLSRKENLSNG